MLFSVELKPLPPAAGASVTAAPVATAVPVATPRASQKAASKAPAGTPPSTPRVLVARVFVSARPLAFVATSEAPRASHLEDLFYALRATVRGSFLDGRFALPVDVAPAVSRTTGETINRILDAVEAASSQLTVEEETPEGLRVSLEPFQKKTLAWMLERERAGGPTEVATIKTTTQMKLYYAHNHFHLHRPARGGFVFQEMVR